MQRPRAFGYIRVSTDGQATDGVSLDAQTAKVTAWADLNGYDLAGIFSDAGISGVKTNRPGLLAALAALKKGDALVVYSISRLSRSTRHTIDTAEQLDKIGADLVSISERIDTTTAAGKMVFRLMAIFAEFERDLISERTTVAMQQKKKQGERVGGIPYGLKLAEDGTQKPKKLEENQGEQEVLEIAKKLKAAGLSLRQIAADLARRGFYSRTGREFNACQIRRMIA